MLIKILLTFILLSSQILLFCSLFGAFTFVSPPQKYDLPNPIIKPILTGILIPLDSRPPCKEFVEKLAHLGGVNLISPPKYILDNYKNPAQITLLRQWLYNSITPSTNFAILSSDMLMHGGLIASRDIHKSDGREMSLFSLLDSIKAKQHGISLSVFTIIPRLLIAENDDTKTWQYHMMQYAILKDKVNTFENPLDFSELEKIQQKIPEKLITKYNNIYLYNDNFNRTLFTALSENKIQKIIIGQDDGEAFGLPNTNRHKAENYLAHLAGSLKNNAYTTRGADEIAQILLAQYVNDYYQVQPKIFLQYSHPAISDKVMPYMPSSVDETAREKVKLVRGEIVNDASLADFILYIHCGDESNSNLIALQQAALEIKQLLLQNKNVALIDLSQNFEANETLLATLITQDVPLSQLIAYASWNTTSNSLGTAISQASIFTTRKKSLDPSDHLALYYENSNFTLSRIIEDWGYLKNILPKTNQHLRLIGLDNYRLGNSKAYTEAKISRDLQLLSEEILYKNFARHPFYKTTTNRFFINSVQLGLSLPWERTFEINLNLKTTIVTTPNINSPVNQ